MMTTHEKIRKIQERLPKKGSRNMFKNIFFNPKDGDNIIRLVGEFLEVKTHFIAPNLNRHDRGLCDAKAFQGNDRLPQLINCLDWDLTTEEPKKVKTCPICKLCAIARQELKNGPSPEEKKIFEYIRNSSFPKTALKWNVIDREDPFILKVENDVEVRVKGFKVATFGIEAWNDIKGIFDQCECDISDVDEGNDICLVKVSGSRTTYSAKAVLVGKTVKVTPLTTEERAMQMHDLKILCGKQIDPNRLFDCLHEDLRDMLIQDGQVSSSSSASSAPVQSSAASSVAEESEPAEEGSVMGDDDAALPEEESVPSTSKKK